MKKEETRKMKVITVSNYKGGCAKTTTAVNLAYDLAAVEDRRVLLIDADALCRIRHNASYTEKMVIPRFLIPI